MLRTTVILPFAFALGVAGCGHAPVTKTNAGVGFSFQAQSTDAPLTNTAQFEELTEQTRTLDQMMNDIVRNSTKKGAMMGAAVGCGVALVTSSNPSKCAASAASSALIGGAVGNKIGNRNGARRIEVVSANALTRSIRRTNDQMDDIVISLRDTLARQDIETANLRRQRDAGHVDSVAYDAHLITVQRNRAELAQALALTAKQAKTATANLQVALANGQTGLEWHISATSQLERDIESARSQINLL